jgi:hypothetical protein
MTGDYYDDLAYQLGDPTRTRYIQPDEEDEEAYMDRKVHFTIPRRPPVTEEWLVRNKFPHDGEDLTVHLLMDREQYRKDVRRAATRDLMKWDLKWSEFLHACMVIGAMLGLFATAAGICWGAVSLVHWLVWR